MTDSRFHHSPQVTSREAILALNLLPSIGPVRISRLLEAFGDAENVLNAPAKSLLRVDGIGQETAKIITSWQDHADPTKELAEAEQRGISIIMVTHEEEVATYARRIIQVRDGLISHDSGDESLKHTSTPAP